LDFSSELGEGGGVGEGAGEGDGEGDGEGEELEDEEEVFSLLPLPNHPMIKTTMMTPITHFVVLLRPCFCSGGGDFGESGAGDCS
jgi:hypothetical protein